MRTENQALPAEVEEDNFQLPAEASFTPPFTREGLEPLQNRLQIAGITPDTLGKYLYTFEAQGKEVADVSADGINHIAQSAGVSSESVEILDEDDESILVQAIAVNSDGVRHIGIVREPKRNDRGYLKPYALQSAVSKAQRNAKKGLLPMTWIRDLIKQATGGLPTADELEGRLENAKDSYRDQREEIVELKDTIKKLEAENAKFR